MNLKKVFPIIALLLIALMAGCKKQDTGSIPTATSTDPLNNVTGVPRNQLVAFTFSEAMDPVTVNSSTFTLTQGTTSIPGTVTYSGTTATFTPTNVLAAVTTYKATITTGAKSLTGNSLAANTSWSFTTGGSTTALAVVNLGTAGNYLILAKTAITNIATSALTGDLGLSPAATSYITGFALTNSTGYATSSQVTGSIYAADMVSPTPVNLTTAINNMGTAYTDAAGRKNPDFKELYAGDISGKTLVPGLYKWGTSVVANKNVVLNGSSTSVFIFQISGNLNAASGVKFTLTGGAQAKNIFWQVAGYTKLGTTSHFEGNILCMTAIHMLTGASLNGRALAQTAVTLDHNVLVIPASSK